VKASVRASCCFATKILSQFIPHSCKDISLFAVEFSINLTMFLLLRF